MKRTKFTAHDVNVVAIEYVNELGNSEWREFRAPRFGGYVWEVYPSGRRYQLCRGLVNSGVPLEWDGDRPLVDIIRREYRRMRRAERV